MNIASYRIIVEISLKLVALPTISSAGSYLVWGASDSRMLQGDMITTQAKIIIVKNISTTVLSSAISTTLPVRQSSKRTEIDTLSRSSVHTTPSMKRTTGN